MKNSFAWNLASLWNNFITSGIPYEGDNPFKHKYFVVKFINIVCLVATVTFSIFSLTLLIPGRSPPSTTLYSVIGFIFLSSFLAIMVLRKTRNVDLAGTIVIIALFFVAHTNTLLTNVLGEDADDIIVSAVVSPLFIFIIKGVRRGVIWVIGYFVLTFGIMIIRPALYEEFDTRLLDLGITIIASQMCMVLYMYVNEKFAEIAEKNKEDLIKALEAEADFVKSKEIFVNIAAHKLRTPVSIIRGTVENLQKQVDPNSPMHNSMVTLQNSSERMHNLVNEILQIFEIDKSSFEEKIQSVNLVKLLHAVVHSQQINAARKSITVEIHAPEDANMELVTDAQHIKEALLNVVSNAIDYSEDGSCVDIYLVKEPEKYIIKILDTGIGIPKISQGLIFQKFYRTEQAVLKKPDGSGLGLYIAKAYLEKHGGKIYFKSPVTPENKGTEFIIELPFEPVKSTH